MGKRDAAAEARVTAALKAEADRCERAAQREREYQAFQARTAAAASRADKRVLRGRGGS
jgi:hypothetical protein